MATCSKRGTAYSNGNTIRVTSAHRESRTSAFSNSIAAVGLVASGHAETNTVPPSPTAAPAALDQISNSVGYHGGSTIAVLYVRSGIKLAASLTMCWRTPCIGWRSTRVTSMPPASSNRATVGAPIATTGAMPCSIAASAPDVASPYRQSKSSGWGCGGIMRLRTRKRFGSHCHVGFGLDYL